MGKHSDNILIFIYLETFTAYNMNVKLMEIYVHLASIVGVTKQAVKLFFHYGPWWTGGRGTSRNVCLGCAARLPKPLPYIRPKSAIYPIYDLTKKYDTL